MIPSPGFLFRGLSVGHQWPSLKGRWPMTWPLAFSTRTLWSTFRSPRAGPSRGMQRWTEVSPVLLEPTDIGAGTEVSSQCSTHRWEWSSDRLLLGGREAEREGRMQKELRRRWCRSEVLEEGWTLAGHTVEWKEGCCRQRPACAKVQGWEWKDAFGRLWVAWKVTMEGPVFQVRSLDFMAESGEFEHGTAVLRHSSRGWSCWRLTRGLGQWPTPCRPQVAEKPKKELGVGCFAPFPVESTLLMSEASGGPGSNSAEQSWY